MAMQKHQIKAVWSLEYFNWFIMSFQFVYNEQNIITIQGYVHYSVKKNKLGKTMKTGKYNQLPDPLCVRTYGNYPATKKP